MKKESQKKFEENIENAVRPGLIRVLAAIFYDLWLVAAIWLIGTTLDTGRRKIFDLSFGEGNYYILQAWFILSPIIFFSWFWTHGGQTIGMRAWRIRILSEGGKQITWKMAFFRCISGVLSWIFFGLGFLWIIVDKNNRSWHDYLSKTILVVTTKRKK
tara:strand:- start:801 stop:1274 length:474 start_codon:yes stop_codon:yes gene_type:complete